MADKLKLIDSMANLIHHVSTNHRNQEEIFATLSIGDIRKILLNLEDTNEKLRKTTLVLLSELLYENASLQKKFCDMTGVPSYPGKIVLCSRFPKNILQDKQKLLSIVNLLKENSLRSSYFNHSEQAGIYWYIDCQSNNITVQIGKRNLFNVDPLHCVFGVWVADYEQERHSLPANNFFEHSINESCGRKLSDGGIDSITRLNRSHQVPKNSLVSNMKPDTPLRISLTNQKTSSNERQKITTETIYITPKQTQSEIKQAPIRFISPPERDTYESNQNTEQFYIKSNNANLNAQVTTNHILLSTKNKSQKCNNSFDGRFGEKGLGEKGLGEKGNVGYIMQDARKN